ncbi:hypothetical protein JL721_2974 [Aureococcus anophagefferens]|nr:hypothetical protein JL721_2974 [Aureococcus anophagefferens]
MEQFKEAESASTLDGAVALERTHPPPARPAAMSEDFRTAGSPLCGAALIRTILHADGTIASSSNATVVGWLDASESEFFNDRDEPAALFRIRYLDGELAGDEEDLEEHERAARKPPPPKKPAKKPAKKKMRAAAPPPPKPNRPAPPLTTPAVTVPRRAAAQAAMNRGFCEAAPGSTKSRDDGSAAASARAERSCVETGASARRATSPRSAASSPGA